MNQEFTNQESKHPEQGAIPGKGKKKLYEVKIDKASRRVLTTWGLSVSDQDLVEYQTKVWKNPEIQGYHELIDFQALQEVKVTMAGLKALATVAKSMDENGGKSRLAIVVGQPVAYGLSRMYQVFRELEDSSSREIQVFQDREAALAWLDNKEF
jgi:hypothetical protein